MPPSLNNPVSLGGDLRCRPNFLVYSLEQLLEADDLKTLTNLEVAYVTFENCTHLDGIKTFCDCCRAGVYLSNQQFIEQFAVNKRHLVLCLVDPHMIGSFEAQFKRSRVGVLIRRRLVAMDHFKQSISLSILTDLGKS